MIGLPFALSLILVWGFKTDGDEACKGEKNPNFWGVNYQYFDNFHIKTRVWRRFNTSIRCRIKSAFFWFRLEVPAAKNEENRGKYVDLYFDV